ncbi:hypothetical protein CH262_13850 [Rhodococcus sp. 05-2255-1e]|uniref:cupin domain-containing protein n=1 Tax=Rhodococcus sp. 05-2255-1e TaxID=2022495 RepID=UPI000B9A3011|nr:cupin domain-containing protein [Rhodococcus sp. 05-2255-1e]OZE24539.1 hypothetical protein CH262_13850 [Rhodococcus sp. 05-2255-1e]
MNGFVEQTIDQKLTKYSVDNADRIKAGTPTVAANRFWTSPDGSVVHGVWEMTEGTIDGFDRDETFVVIAGRATITFTNRNTTHELVPGSICVMHRGDPASITVHETLRKVFVVHGTPSA